MLLRAAQTMLSRSALKSVGKNLPHLVRSFGTEPQQVVLLGHPALRIMCTPCGDDALDDEKASLVATLEDFRSKNGFGRGIAAPQIGVPRRFIAVNMGSGPRVLTDPKITWKSDETFTLFDDCMSLPWLLCKVRRHSSISVEFVNEDKEVETWDECDTPLSELLQHELDHLDGRLIVDIAEGGGLGIISRDAFERDPESFRADVDYFIEPTIT